MPPPATYCLNDDAEKLVWLGDVAQASLIRPRSRATQLAVVCFGNVAQ